MARRVFDQKGRWRSKIVAFRMSPEEDAQLETAVRLSGLTKQDYIIKRLQERDIVVVGNPKVFKALYKEMATIQTKLMELGAGEGVGDELMETIHCVAVTLEKMMEVDSSE
ncbi:MAG: hypothetical protein FWG10_03225 [Eubacteriaceae bacterium]|nr:hypothetical protein [Eubacteriaceae bacterium]